MKIKLVSQGGSEPLSLKDALDEALADGAFDRLDVAVAYATIGGYNLVREATGGREFKFRWLVGLDDAVTQPKLLRKISDADDSELLVCSLGPSRRFHPKIVCSWASDDQQKCILLVGSGNLTNHGLQKNAEAGIVLEAETEHEVSQLKSMWDDFEGLGENLTAQLLLDYEDSYKKAKKARRRSAKKSEFVSLADDALEAAGDVSMKFQSSAWVDIGSAMAKGREIEFPKDMLDLIGISADETSPKEVSLIGPDNNEVPAQFKRREDNGMWRVHIPKEVPGSDQLRIKIAGKLQRSTQALILGQTAGKENTFDVKFVEIDSDEYLELIKKSKAGVTFGRTQPGPSGRNFGGY